MFYTIYRVTNLVNGKIYIGKHQTKNLDDDYMGSGKRLGYAKKKHGLENFKKEILFVFETEQEMNDKEKELVTEEFCLREDTYNLCVGGKGGWSYANFINPELRKSGHTPEMYFLVFQKLKGRKNPDASMRMKEHHKNGKIRYNTYGMLGKKHSTDTKSKMSSSQSGSHNSQFGLLWITNGTDSKKIKKNDSIPEGWKKGRKIKCPERVRVDHESLQDSVC